MTTPETPRRRRPLFVILPLAVFLALAALFFVRLFAGDPSRIPSALVGKAAPAIDLQPLAGLSGSSGPVPGITSAQLKGKVALVNVWASWCVPCREEHPVLMGLSRDPRILLVGLNYKDQPDNARRFLGTFGLPYAAVGVDASGRSAIDWGVYGVPETFVLAPDGTIAQKFVGPLSEQTVREQLMPLIERLSGKPAA
ncbi:thiol:disulfide oxidoreductase periplasmic protein [Azorhizobium caulinodans ORS 571]|uniref:Thiol:disulfide oxidoreductase periplasmic protein n=1 Tax=Azorhizobium caulinodans (strain ATCC 43989 / DSM 5975 / JCM 20966 / LMG 6465 / NBRC 14845 / NCIMB 13405 / ORS 571) TaxID=438753 RepID=A8HWP5_AZOC5|nr:DsbE family thiol:disulfide interchange protein [Azorhizobium caulinodans]BAF90453.1 thiol:disulfide oxidoreductase periplasmic protein [Azorhizobium caulinodans ORS 571]